MYTVQMAFGLALTITHFVLVVVTNGCSLHGTDFSLLISKVYKLL